MLSAEQVEQAFIETAEEQTGGPFDWRKLTAKLNARLTQDVRGTSEQDALADLRRELDSRAIDFNSRYDVHAPAIML